MQGNKFNVTTEIWEAIAADPVRAIVLLEAQVTGRVPEGMIEQGTATVRGQGLASVIEARTLVMAVVATQVRIGAPAVGTV